MRSSRTSALRLGLFGSLIAVVGLLVPAQIDASSSEPIVESLEFSDAAVLSYTDAIVADYSANAGDPSLGETALTGASFRSTSCSFGTYPTPVSSTSSSA